jgi:hypothetical protein
MPIQGFSELVLESPRPRADMEILMSYLRRIHIAAQKAAELVSHLEQLCQPSEPQLPIAVRRSRQVARV